MTSDFRPAFTRREFLGQGMLLASAALAAPAFIQRSAQAMTAALVPGLSSQPGTPEDRILVVVQLSGGNDGLNTVVPFSMPEYYKARPGIALPQDKVLKLGKSGQADGVGLHPSMANIKELYDAGEAAIVQGVGYPNPNRSHFKSMDIWHTADTSATGNGWLGRYFDSECCGFGKGESGKRAKSGAQAAQAPNVAPVTAPGIAIGRTAPLAMQGQRIKPISFESADLFRWSGKDIHPSLNDPYEKLNRAGAPDAESETSAAFLMRTALDAQISSDLIRKAVAQRPLVQYPGTQLGRELSMVASMIRAGLKTRVYYVSQGGFDTHAGQGGEQGRHAQLMQQFSQSIKAFLADLKAQENQNRVLVVSFSEFGRRVAQNASQGTDHGTAAPMFLFGPMVKAGVHGEHPSLRDLDEGDLKHRIDFRSVYAGILEDWMAADSKKILEGAFNATRILKKV